MYAVAPTSDSQSMTPDELRRLAEARKNECGRMVYDAMRAAADALDAAAAAQQTLLAALNESTCENDTLRTRLEEAEEAIANAKKELLDIRWPDGEECQKDCRVCRAEEILDAALAGKERP